MKFTPPNGKSFWASAMPFPRYAALDMAVERGMKSDLLRERESSPFLASPSESEDTRIDWKQQRRTRPSCLVWIITVVVTAFLSSGITVIILRKLNDGQCQHMENRPLLDRYVPPDSPLLEIDRTVSTELFRPWNFTPSIWNEHPSLGRVDKLWDEKAGVKSHFFMIPIDRGAPYGLDPRTHVVYKDMPGSVPHGFPVMLEGIHHLHCLDSLRRKLFMNRDWYKENWEVFANRGMEDAHTSHCLDMIRQVLTCRADIGILGWKWVAVKGNNLPDFSRPHQCLSFEALLDWSKEHGMPNMFQDYESHQAPPDDAVFADWELFHGDLGDMNRWLKTDSKNVD